MNDLKEIRVVGDPGEISLIVACPRQDGGSTYTALQMLSPEILPNRINAAWQVNMIASRRLSPRPYMLNLTIFAAVVAERG